MSLSTANFSSFLEDDSTIPHDITFIIQVVIKLDSTIPLMILNLIWDAKIHRTRENMMLYSNNESLFLKFVLKVDQPFPQFNFTSISFVLIFLFLKIFYFCIIKIYYPPKLDKMEVAKEKIIESLKTTDTVRTIWKVLAENKTFAVQTFDTIFFATKKKKNPKNKLINISENHKYVI